MLIIQRSISYPDLFDHLLHWIFDVYIAISDELSAEKLTPKHVSARTLIQYGEQALLVQTLPDLAIDMLFRTIALASFPKRLQCHDA